MTYKHPGKLFLKNHGPVRAIPDVVRYADFLRSEARISHQPPVDLQRIRQEFGIPMPIVISLPGQQGILLDHYTGKIYINEDDPETRQRFSYAHELVELVFAIQEKEYPTIKITVPKKERLCEQGAAALLMPSASFSALMHETGVHLEGASTLARLYQTSFLATLVHLIHQSKLPLILVLWQFAYKPSEIVPTAHQLSFEVMTEPSLPQKKLRVWWSLCSPQLPRSQYYVPPHISAPQDSCICQSYQSGELHRRNEEIHFGARSIRGLVEAKRITIGTERCVVTLIHLDNVSGRTLDLM